MKNRILFATASAIVFCSPMMRILSAEKVDPRLATMQKVWVQPVDPLADDQRVAACLIDHLTKMTPLTTATSRIEADAILLVKAHLTSGAARVLLGSAGGTPSANLEAQLTDGTKLWADGAKFRRGNGAIGLARDVECGLADGLLNTLRDAMRKARDAKVRLTR